MTTILVISAHLDDAVFSAGGAIAQAAQAGARVIVATLFTGNVARPQGFALACQTDKGLSPAIDYMALRREEDRAACAVLGAEAWHGPLLEAPHRGYDNPAALFGPPGRDDDAGSIRDVLLRIIHEATPDTVWAPRAIGHHVDHVLVHRSLRAIAPAVPVFWYADFPYADRANAPDPETSKLGGLSWLKSEFSLRFCGMKADACSAYRSQLGYQFGGEAPLRRLIARQSCEVFALCETMSGRIAPTLLPICFENDAAKTG